jgi:hypothetical protein
MGELQTGGAGGSSVETAVSGAASTSGHRDLALVLLEDIYPHEEYDPGARISSRRKSPSIEFNDIR